MSRVFVAGGTGVLGRALIPDLVAAGHDVDVLARRLEVHGLVTELGGRPVEGDLLGGLRPIDADVVVHVATAIPRPDGGTGSWALNDRIRIEGTGALVDAARRGNVRRIVGMSVGWVYGDHGAAWITESDQVAESLDLRPELRSALVLESTIRTAPLEWVIARCGWLYGPGTGVTESMFRAAAAGSLRTNGAGGDFVSLVTAGDAARAISLAVGSIPSGTIVNVVDDEPLRERELFAAVARHVGGPPPRPGPLQPGWGSQRISNRLARSLGFRPRHRNIDDGLAVLCSAPEDSV